MADIYTFHTNGLADGADGADGAVGAVGAVGEKAVGELGPRS
jgi:hypothetical protein